MGGMTEWFVHYTVKILVGSIECDKPNFYHINLQETRSGFIPAIHVTIESLAL